MTAAARRKRRTGAKTDQIDASGNRQDPSPRTRSVDPCGALIPTKTPLVRDRLPPRTPRRTRHGAEPPARRYGETPKRVPHRNHFSGQRQRTQPSRSYAARRQICSGSCGPKSYHPDTGIEPPGQRPCCEETTRAVKASGTTLTDICAIAQLGAAEIIAHTGNPGNYTTKDRHMPWPTVQPP